MNICMFTNTYLPHVGGVARSVDTLATECRRAGHAVQVVAPGFPGDERVPDADVLRVPALQRFNGSDFSVRVPIPGVITRRIDRFAPQVVHSHHPFLLGDAALRIAYERNLPLVFTHHTLYENYTHYVPFDSPALKRFVIRLATEYANCCDAVIAPSNSVADLLRERGVQVAIEVIPTGVDTRTLASGDGEAFRAAHGIPAGACVIGHVGRLAKEKNLPYLADAISRTLAANDELHALIVGDGPEEGDIRRRLDRAGVLDRVVLPGKLTGQDLVDAYAAMDVFTFASHTETQGMVIAEAMAAGLPVVALDGPGVRDVVADGRNGRLLGGDASRDDFAGALSAACREPPTREAWREAALETAARLDQSNTAADVQSLYSSLRSREPALNPDWAWLERLRGRIEAEWSLLSSKADSATGTLRRHGSAPDG